MKLKLAAVAVALLLFATGAAMALPGQMPDNAQANEHAQADDHTQAPADGTATPGSAPADGQTDDRADRASGHGPPSTVPGHGAAANGSQGPPTDMPGVVPDFVSEIHSLIGQFLDGEINESELGERLADVTPGNESAENETGPDGESPESAGESADADDRGSDERDDEAGDSNDEADEDEYADAGPDEATDGPTDDDRDDDERANDGEGDDGAGETPVDPPGPIRSLAI